jgi:DNA-binding transcriptional LysR family regulator
MPDVNLKAFDLNLLLVFDAMMRERNVTRAGATIGLSQPAMSHALNRLRQHLDDDLFVRTPLGMAPTARAEALAAPLYNALADVRLALEPLDFQPATAQRRFTLAFNNYAAVLIAPPLAAAVTAAAPGVVLDIRPRGTLDLDDRLDRGDLDLALDAIEAPPERFAMIPVVEDEIVLVMGRDHQVSGETLSAAEVAGLRHLDISSVLDDTEFIDGWFAARGLTRQVAMRAPFLAAPHILVQSDLVASMSHRIAKHLLRHYPLRVVRTPYTSPHVRLCMQWHRRVDRHPAHRWLRETIQAVAAGL